MKMPAALLCLALAAGCSTSKPAGVTAATSDQVGSCRYVDDVIGNSGYYGVMASKGVENARAEAMQKAGALGANRVVWGTPALGYGSTSVTARAYSC